MKQPIVLAITGASGAIYALRLLEVLIASGRDVYLSISESGRVVLDQELDIKVDLNDFQVSDLLLAAERESGDSRLDWTRAKSGIVNEDSSVLSVQHGKPGEIIYCHHQDMMAPIASGSFLTAGMVICPCSGSTLSAVSHALTTNLIQRAAEVHLKERRKLIVVPREMPLSLPQIDNMRRLTEAGGIVMPASPGFYHGVKTIRDLIDFVVGRVCDQLGVEHALMRRWGEESPGG